VLTALFAEILAVYAPGKTTAGSGARPKAERGIYRPAVCPAFAGAEVVIAATLSGCRGWGKRFPRGVAGSGAFVGGQPAAAAKVAGDGDGGIRTRVRSRQVDGVYERSRRSRSRPRSPRRRGCGGPASWKVPVGWRRRLPGKPAI